MWKFLLGDSYQPTDSLEARIESQQPTVNSEQINDCESSIEDLNSVEDVIISTHVSDAVSKLLSGPNFRIEKADEVLRNWYESEYTDCGWEPLTDAAIVTFIQNGRVEAIKVIEELQAADNENNCDSNLKINKVTFAQAYENLKTFKT